MKISTARSGSMWLLLMNAATRRPLSSSTTPIASCAMLSWYALRMLKTASGLPNWTRLFSPFVRAFPITHTTRSRLNVVHELVAPLADRHVGADAAALTTQASLRHAVMNHARDERVELGASLAHLPPRRARRREACPRTRLAPHPVRRGAAAAPLPWRGGRSVRGRPGGRRAAPPRSRLALKLSRRACRPCRHADVSPVPPCFEVFL